MIWTNGILLRGEWQALKNRHVPLMPTWMHFKMRVYGYKTLLQGETEIFAEEIKNKIGPEWAEHFRNKNNRTDIGERLKDPQR